MRFGYVSTPTANAAVGTLAGIALAAHFQEIPLLQTIAIVLVILWLLGIVSSYTMGGFIHILLVAALVVVLLRLIQGRRL